MINQSDLNDAVQFAKDLLVGGSTADAAAVRAAKEYDVPEKAVRARFESTFRKPMEAMQGVTVVKSDPMAEALEKAANRFQSPTAVKLQSTFGRVVVVPDLGRCRFVAWDGRKCWVLREDTMKMWTTTHRCLLDQIAAIATNAAIAA